MANKTAIQGYLKGASLFAFVFAFSFFMMQEGGNIFQANILNSGVTNVLNSSVQCSVNQKFQIPVTGESGEYHLSIDQTGLGKFYLNDDSSNLQTAIDATSDDTIWFVGNRDNVIGDGTITVTDRNTGAKKLLPLRVSFPCVQTMKFCKDRTLTDGVYNCVPYQDSDLTVVSGKTFDVNYLEFVFYGGKRTVEKLPLSNIEIKNEMTSTTSGGENVLGSGIKYASLINENTYSSLSAKYSQNLNFSVTGVNCALEENDIYSNTRAIFTPDSTTLTSLPQPASTIFVFSLKDHFFIEGYSLKNVRYNFEFLAIEQSELSENFQVVSNTATTQSYKIFYKGTTAQEQMNSIVKVFGNLPLSQRILQIAIRNSNQLYFETLERGLSNNYNTGNTWSVGKENESLFSFNTPAQAGTVGGFETMEEYFESFPDTMVVGDILMAYYPGGEGYGLWSASNTPTSGEGSVVTLERIEGVVGNEGLPGSDTTTETGDKCIVSVDNSQYDITSSDYASTYTCGTDITSKLLDEHGTVAKMQKFIDEKLVAYLVEGDENSGNNVSDNQQYLEGYNYYFATVKATQPGIAMLHVNGINCSQSKKITVVPEDLQIYVQGANDTDFYPVTTGTTSLSVNDILALDVRYENSQQPIDPAYIEWVVTDNKGGEIVKIQKNPVGIDTDGKYVYETVNSLIAQAQGTAFLRAKVKKSDDSYFYSKTLVIQVGQGMEVNGKGYDHTVEIFPGGNDYTFTVAGLLNEDGSSRFQDLQWVTDDVTHGEIQIGGDYNQILQYRSPANDGSSRMYIDNLRVIDKKSNQAINIAIHIKPPKIVQQYITTADQTAMLLNASPVRVQDSVYGTPWTSTLEIKNLPNNNETLQFTGTNSCTLTFDKHSIELDVKDAQINPGGTDSSKIIVSGNADNILLSITPDLAGTDAAHSVTVQNLVQVINGNVVAGIEVTDTQNLLNLIAASGNSTSVLSSASNGVAYFTTQSEINGIMMASFASTGLTFVKSLSNDLDCNDGLANIIVTENTEDVRSALSLLTIPGYLISREGNVVYVKSDDAWTLKNNTNGDFSTASFEGKAGARQIDYFLPDTSKILAGDKVILTINGKIIETATLTQTTEALRRTEIIQMLNAKRALIDEFVTFSAYTTNGTLLSSDEVDVTSQSLERLVMVSQNPGESFVAKFTSLHSPNAIQVRLGRSVDLKIVALLEDGSVAEWYTSSNHVNPQVFGNPTWETSAMEGLVTVEQGRLLGQGVGQGAISIVAPTRWYEAASSVANTTTTGSSSWVERTDNNPTVSVAVEVLPAFKINGSFKTKSADAADVLSIVAKSSTPILFTVSGVATGETLKWAILEDQSGVQLTTSGQNMQYKPGIRADESAGIIDILRVSDNYVSYDIHVAVNPATIDEMSLTKTSTETIHVGDTIPMTLSYKLSNGTQKTFDFNGEGIIPGELGDLQWTSSESSVVQIENGAAIAMKEGETIITVTAGSNPTAKASLAVTVEGRAAKIVSGSTKITPSFPAVDALIHLETTVYHKDGIGNVDEVAIKFNSPYLSDAMLKLDDAYWKQYYGSMGITPEEAVVDTLTETEETTTTETETTQTIPRQARYLLDYQLPGEAALDGKTITYVLSVTTNKGMRTEETFSQVGTITVGAVQNICTSGKRLSCLIRGLSCLKEKQTGTLSEECDKVISVFTNEPASFSILDILKTYRTLK